MRDRNIAKWVADRIGALRKAAKLSLRELARRSNLGAEVVSRAERGLQTPSIQTLERICDGLGTSLGGFFGDGAAESSMANEFRRLSGLLGALAPDARREVLDGLARVVKAIQTPLNGVVPKTAQREAPRDRRRRAASRPQPEGK